jgi:hypothetical protein
MKTWLKTIVDLALERLPSTSTKRAKLKVLKNEVDTLNKEKQKALRRINIMDSLARIKIKQIKELTKINGSDGKKN